MSRMRILGTLVDRRHRSHPRRTPAELEQELFELKVTRQRRELWFWTISATIGLVVFLGVSVAFMLALMHGSAFDPVHMVIGAALTAAGLRGVVATVARDKRSQPG